MVDSAGAAPKGDAPGCQGKGFRVEIDGVEPGIDRGFHPFHALDIRKLRKRCRCAGVVGVFRSRVSGGLHGVQDPVPVTPGNVADEWGRVLRWLWILFTLGVLSRNCRGIGWHM
ncbi:hypothetical protein GCM10009628_13920 [Paeniglutamicibacter kerguelensis]